MAAENGLAGLELLRRHRPDLVLCDVNMPEAGGWHVLREVREDAEIADTQFVLMTGNLHEHTPRAGMEGGADDFLAKPFGHAELLRCVEARLRRAGINRRLTDAAVAELRSTLHSALPHELFTPLAEMLGLVDVLRDEGAPVDDAERADLLAEVHRSGWRLHRTLRNYLFAIELETGGARPADVAAARVPAARLHEVINEGARAAAARHRRESDVAVRLESCDGAGCVTDIALMVEELVDNACAYSRPGTLIEVGLNEAGVLTVTDRGRGMDEAQLADVRALRQFDRKRPKRQGLGLGLYVVQKLAARCGADFAIESKPEEGTVVRVGFPVGGVFARADARMAAQV